MGTTAEKGARVLQSIAEVQEGINNLGGSLTDQTPFKDFKAQLDNIYDNLPKTEFQEGTSVTIENGLKGKLDFDDGKVGFGQASQESTQGYNLLPKNAPTTLSANGLTCTIKEDGRIILNGTTTALTTFYVLGNGDVTQTRLTLPAGTYTGTLGKDVVANNRLMVNIMQTNNTQVFPSQLRWVTYETVTLNEETYVGNMNITALSDTTFNNYELDIMILSGTYTSSNMPNFEKYTGGYASPSPNWEQEVKCVAGRNKLDVSTNTNGYVLSSTGELNQVEGYCVSDFIPVQPGATYNVSYMLLSSVQDADNTRVGFYDSSKTFISRPYSADNPYIITIPSNCHYVRLSYLYPARSEMQFEEGSAIHSYLPYGVIQETIRSKNIFDFAKLKNGNPGMNYPDRASITFGEDSFRIDVTTVGDNFTNSGMTVTNQTIQSYQRKFLYEVKPNTKYTFIFETEHSEPVGLSSYYCLANKNFVVTNYDNTYVNFITIDSTHRRFYRTFTTKSDTKYVGFRYGDQGSVSVTYSKIMLVEGEYTSSNLPEYTPYVTPRTYQFSLGNNKFYGIGDYADELLYDVDEDKVYKKAYIGETTFTGASSENWYKDENPSYLRYKIQGISDMKNQASRQECYSNYFKFSSNSYVHHVGDMFCYWIDNGSIFLYPSADITSVDLFKQWLSTHNTTVCYMLETPTLTELTDTNLHQQVKNWYYSQSFTGTTILESNGDLPMILKVRALKGES